jgi:putative membrane protein
MRVLFILLCLSMLSAGLLFGGLNAEPIAIDFYFIRFDAVRSGVALLLAALIGALLAGLALSLSVIVPLQRRLRRAYRAAAPRSGVPADASLPVVP